MNAPLLWLPVLACVLLALLLWRWETRLRRGMGLRGIELVASDDSRVRVATLRCEPLGLVGRPDHLARAGKAYVPVEVKPAAASLRESHVLQLAAQCLLVQHTYGARPPFGLAVLANGRREVVPFTPDLERRVLSTMAEMRRALLTGEAPADTGSRAKCRTCAFWRTCPASRVKK